MVWRGMASRRVREISDTYIHYTGQSLYHTRRRRHDTTLEIAGLGWAGQERGWAGLGWAGHHLTSHHITSRPSRKSKSKSSFNCNPSPAYSHIHIFPYSHIQSNQIKSEQYDIVTSHPRSDSKFTTLYCTVLYCTCSYKFDFDFDFYFDLKFDFHFDHRISQSQEVPICP